MIVFFKKNSVSHKTFFEDHFEIIGAISVICLVAGLTKIRTCSIEALAVVGAGK
jgi:hypothetical protein